MSMIPMLGIECVLLEAFAGVTAVLPQLGGPLASWLLHSMSLVCI